MTTSKQAPAILRATPGRILKEEFLDGFNLTQAELSERTGIPRSTVNEIIKGKRPINAYTALALGIFFGISAQFWLNLQTQFDIRRVQIEKEAQLRSRIRRVAVALRHFFNTGKGVWIGPDTLIINELLAVGEGFEPPRPSRA